MGHVTSEPHRDPAPQTLWPRNGDRHRPPLTHAEHATRKLLVNGSSFELFTGVIAVGLTIAGLAGFYPRDMAALATIAIGLALLAQGLTVASRWRQAIHIVGRETTDRVGITTEMFGGLAGIVLGLLALLQVAPRALLPAAAIVIGIALLLGGPAQPDIAESAPAVSPGGWRVTRDAMRTSTGVMVMAGLGAVTLGVLAAVGVLPVVTVTLVAFLCTASALILAGGTLFARFAKQLA